MLYARYWMLIIVKWRFTRLPVHDEFACGRDGMEDPALAGMPLICPVLRQIYHISLIAYPVLSIYRHKVPKSLISLQDKTFLDIILFLSYIIRYFNAAGRVFSVSLR